MAAEIFSTDGLVLKIRNTGESDRIVTALTRDRGVLSAFAKSARRPKSRLNGGTQSFCFSDLSFARSRGGSLNITEAQPKQVFYDLNKDLTVLSLAQYFSQLAEELVPPEACDEEPLRLLLNALYLLCEKKRPPMLVKSVVELRLCAWAGYSPALSGCAECGGVTQEMFLDCLNGVFYCKGCGSAARGARVGEAAYGAVAEILTGDMKRAFSVSLPQDAAGELSALTERFVLSQTERRYSSLDFLKSLSV